jgi:hypothetical protein
MHTASLPLPASVPLPASLLLPAFSPTVLVHMHGDRGICRWQIGDARGAWQERMGAGPWPSCFLSAAHWSAPRTGPRRAPPAPRGARAAQPPSAPTSPRRGPDNISGRRKSGRPSAFTFRLRPMGMSGPQRAQGKIVWQPDGMNFADGCVRARARARACVRACVRVCVRACVRACVRVWGACLASGSAPGPHPRFDPSTCTTTDTPTPPHPTLQVILLLLGGSAIASALTKHFIAKKLAQVGWVPRR